MTIADPTENLIDTDGEWISSVESENAVMSDPALAEAVATQRAFLADIIPRWQIPERWAFVAEAHATSVGQFDKKVIRARYADGDYDVRRIARSSPCPARL